jgi:hypothetical protein
VVVNLFYVAVVVIVLRAWHMVDVTGDPQYASQLDRVSYLANNTLRGTFMVIGLVASFDILYELWKMLGARRSTTV